MQDLFDAIADYSITTALIVSGAVAHSMAGWSSARSNSTEYDWIDWLIALSIALFSGVMFALVATVLLDATHKQSQLAAALGAFLGLDGARRLADAVLNTITAHLKRREE